MAYVDWVEARVVVVRVRGGVQSDVVASDRPGLGFARVGGGEGFDARGDVVGHDGDAVTRLEGAGLETAGDGEGRGGQGLDVVDCQAERGGEGVGAWFGGVELFDEGRACVPGCKGRRGAGEDVLAEEAGAGDEGEGSWGEAEGGEEGGHLCADLVEAVFGPVAGVHLVDGDDDPLDADGSGEESVLFGLAAETGFEFAFGRVDDEDGEVGLTSSGDHFGNEVLVAGCVEDGEVGFVGGEFFGRDVGGHSMRSFFRSLVEYPCECKGALSGLFGFLFEPVDGVLINGAEVDE